MKILFTVFLLMLSGVSSAFSKQDINPIIQQVDPYVMCIKSERVIRGKKQILTGTGVQIEPGLVATVWHQVVDVTRIVVYTVDDQASEAKVLAKDVANDLALLQIAKRPGGIAVAPRNSVIGEEVFSIGCPFGMAHSLARGYVKKPLTDWGGREYIQLDMSVNTGDSGAPVINMKGEWVGTVDGYLKEAKSISFAVPINKMVELLKQQGQYAGDQSTPIKPAVAAHNIESLWLASQRETGQKQTILLKQIVNTPAHSNRDLFRQGLAYYAMGELERAGIFIAEYVQTQKADYIAHVLLGEIYLHQDKFKPAKDILRKASIIDPEYATTYLYLGEVYDRGFHDVITAAKHYQRYLQLAPNSSESFRVKRWLANHPLN